MDKGGKTRLGATTGSVVSQLRNMILDGHYSQEERLPAERNLAEEFEVSRGTIRTALQSRPYFSATPRRFLNLQGLIVRPRTLKHLQTCLTRMMLFEPPWETHELNGSILFLQKRCRLGFHPIS